MQTAAAEPALAAGPLDEQLTARLLQQRIIVLDSEVEDRIANRLCAQLLRPDVATICMGQAASAAAVLLAAGTPGKRAVLRHAKVLLHQPSGEARGALPDLAVQAAEMARVRADMEEILSQHTGHPVAQIRLDTDRDKTLSAQEAVDYGLADQVITTRKAAPAELLSA